MDLTYSLLTILSTTISSVTCWWALVDWRHSKCLWYDMIWPGIRIFLWLQTALVKTLFLSSYTVGVLDMTDGPSVLLLVMECQAVFTVRRCTWYDRWTISTVACYGMPSSLHSS